MIDKIERLAKLSPVSTWALFGAGVSLSLALALMVVVMWQGGWTAVTEHQRIDYLGCVAVITSLNLAVVIAALSRARISAKGPGGLSYEVSTDEGKP